MGSTGLFLGWTLTGCGNGEESGGETGEADQSLMVENCNDYSKVSASEIKKRESLGYVESTPIPDKHCSNCQLYIPAKEGQNCGGCILFKGPVFEEGYCTYWAPQV